MFLLGLSASLVLLPTPSGMSALRCEGYHSAPAPLLVHRRESLTSMNDQAGRDDWVGGYCFSWLLVPQLL